MKTRFGFIDPGAIMGVVVALIILAVGVFAFFITANELTWPVQVTDTYEAHVINQSNFAMGNASVSADSVFNIIGIVLLIGAIMSIVGLVYNYVR